jgi:hypothetical protein
LTTYLEATTARDAATIRTANLALAASLDVNVAGFDDTAPQRAIFECDARALAAEEGIRVKLAKAGFITKAAEAGEDFLDEALTWFDLDNGFGGKGRIPATKAVWDLKLTNAAAVPYSFTMAAGELIAQANDGTLFESTPIANATILAGGTLLLRFTAMVAGTSGNQVVGNIVHLETGKPGLTVTNASTAVLVTAGRNVETAAEATRRALGKWATLGAGWTAASFDYLVPLFAPTVTRWFVRTDNPNGPGTIEVVMANAAGASSPSENTAVLAGLGSRDVMTLGTGGLTVVSATVKVINLVGTHYSDGTNPTLEADVTAAILTLQAGFPIGGDSDGLARTELITTVMMGGGFPVGAPLVIQSANGSPVSIVIPGFSGAKDITLSSPASNTTVAATEIISFQGAGLVFA